MKTNLEHKTTAGTILPIMNIKGKPYLQVAHRLVWFIEENAQYDISTQLVAISPEGATCKATITIFTGDKILRKVTATKTETVQGFADFVEKAETGSIGRALAMLGYGTQFTGDELNEGTRLADSPIDVPKKSNIVTQLIGAANNEMVDNAVENVVAKVTQLNSSGPKGFKTRSSSISTDGDSL